MRNFNDFDRRFARTQRLVHIITAVAAVGILVYFAILGYLAIAYGPRVVDALVESIEKVPQVLDNLTEKKK